MTSTNLALFFISLFFSWQVLAQSSFGGVTINGDNVSRDYDTKSVTVQGNVEITIGDQKLSCDRAVLNLEKKTVVASGNVLLQSPTTVIQATKIEYNYQTKTGQIENGVVQSGQIVFEGKKVERTGELTFIAKDARYTSCTTCPAAWSFSGKEINAEIGGYAFIKYPVLRVADFPVFILPRAIIPLKSERQTGLLVPSLELSSRSGTGIEQQFFWAIDKSRDATIGVTYYEKRGLKPHLEYRYMLDAESSGILQTSYVEDKVFSDDGISNSQARTLDRSFVHYKHRYLLPDNIVHRAELNFASDLRYPRDFSEDLEGHGDPALENNVSFTQNTETQHRSIEAAYYVNLLEENAQASNDRAVHRFPEINYNIAQQEIGKSGLFWKLDSNYVNFARRDFAFDDVSGTDSNRRILTDPTDPGYLLYDPETDLLRTGHRLIIAPTLSYPFRIGSLFDIVPSVSYNETQYRFNATPDVGTCPVGLECTQNAVRRYVQTDLAVRTKTQMVFGSDAPLAKRYKHEIVPEVIYSTIPWKDLPRHVFFGDFEDQPYSRRAEQVTNDDFFGSSKLQFDYRDRLFNKELATFVITNNLIQKYFVGDVPTYHKLLTFRLRQSYDFNEEGQADPQPWSPVNALLDLRGERFETHTVADYYTRSKVTNWSTRLRYKTQMKNYFEVTYTRERFVDEKNAPSGFTREIENYGLGVGQQAKYFGIYGRANFSNITKEFEGWEYIATLKPPGECWTIDFEQSESVSAETKTKFNLNFEFGGQI